MSAFLADNEPPVRSNGEGKLQRGGLAGQRAADRQKKGIADSSAYLVCIKKPLARLGQRSVGDRRGSLQTPPAAGRRFDTPTRSSRELRSLSTSRWCRKRATPQRGDQVTD